MSILILNSFLISSTPYHEWLRDAGDELVLLTSRDSFDGASEEGLDLGALYAHAESFANYSLNGNVERAAVRLHERFAFREIVALSELDLLRAARLRERLGIPGQTLASARAYRDKVVMKDTLRAAGVPVAPYAAVESATDILEFVAEHGYPVVVKPRAGAGSMGVTVVRDAAELRAAVLRGLTPHITTEPSAMVEGYVAGEVVHVDGVVANGRLVLRWPSRYVNDMLGWHGDEGWNGSVMLAPADPRTAALSAFAERVVAAMPTPPATAFHAEIFCRPDGSLALCEIASRIGGGRINAMIEAAFGVNLLRVQMRSQAGVDRAPAPVTAPPREFAGFAIVRPRPGVLRELPAAMPFAWAQAYRRSAKVGQTLKDAASSVDAIASFVTTGASPDAVLERLRLATSWLQEHIVVGEPAEVPA